MLIFLNSKKEYKIKDIEGLDPKSKKSQYMIECLKAQKDFTFHYPENLNSSDRRVYRAGFLKLTLNHFFFNMKKSDINEFLREKFEVNLNDRNINRNVKKFKEIFKN